MREEPFRAFVAVEIPEPITVRCAELIGRLKGEAGRVSWVRPANLHMTLKFLGNAYPAQAKRLVESLAHKLMKLSPFEVEIGGLGVFPSPRRPRVIWVGIGEGSEALRDLANKVDGAASKAGFPREARAFSPHLTLGRVKMGGGPGARSDPGAGCRGDLGSLLARENPCPLGRFSVDEVVLVHSRLDPAGAVHTPIQRVRLGRRAGESE